MAGLLVALAASSPAAAREPSWEPAIYPDDQIFPSVILSTATLREPEVVLGDWPGPHLGDPTGLIGVYLDDAPRDAKVRVEIEPNAVIRGGSIEVTLPAKRPAWMIHPKVDYDFEALAKVRQPRPLNVTMEVSVNGSSLGRQTVTVNLRSINDCLFAVAEDEETNSDFSYLFAAYVNENHPRVDEILCDALDSGIVDSFDGYQSGDPDRVMAQVYALWDAMQKRGLKYSNTVTTSFNSETVLSQRVRLFEDSIRARQANCVDGTVLFAAVLRRIGLYPYLVVIPGHMFLAVDLDEEGGETMGLETTLMGTPDPGDEEDSDWVSGRLRRIYGKRTSWKSFAAAVEIGSDAIDEHWDDFENGDVIDYQIVDVSDARDLGIQPIVAADDN